MSIEVMGGGDVTRNTFIQIQFDQVTSSSTEMMHSLIQMVM